MSARFGRAFKRLGLVKNKVIINMKSGNAFEGILWDQAGSLIVLRHARLLSPQSPPVDVDGEVIIERSDIEFIQLTHSGGGF